jgi:hypothetical protein
MPKDKAGTYTLVVDTEEVELFSELAMLSLPRQLPLLDVLLELIFILKREKIHTRELFVLLITSPVRAREGIDRETVRWDLAGVIHMGTGAHILEGAVHIEADFGLSLLGELKAVLNLVTLAPSLQVLDGLSDRTLRLYERLALSDDLAHLLLDGLEVLRGKGRIEIEVVITTVINRWTEGELSVRANLKDSLSHYVSERVSDFVEMICVFFHGVPFNLTKLLHRRNKIKGGSEENRRGERDAKGAVLLRNSEPTYHPPPPPPLPAPTRACEEKDSALTKQERSITVDHHETSPSTL